MAGPRLLKFTDAFVSFASERRKVGLFFTQGRLRSPKKLLILFLFPFLRLLYCLKSPFEALGPSIVAAFHDISYDSTDHGRELEAMPAPTTGYDESFPVWILVDQKVAIKRIAVHAHALFKDRCLC